MAGRKSRVGRHLPTSGGLKKTLERAGCLGCETVQIFISNPQGWTEPTSRPDGEAFLEGSRVLGLRPVVVHTKYLINLASPDAELRERSARALALEMVAAGEVGAHLAVVHSGSHGGDGAKKGLDRLVAGLDRAREMAESYAGASDRIAEPVLENSVGAGTRLCWSFDALGEAARRAGVRVCVDTAHAFVAGYDLSTPEGGREVAEEIRSILGDSVAILHLNDARNARGSNRDGHRRIGEGQIPQEVWRGFFAVLDGVPVIMETPYGTPEVDAEQVKLVKELAGGLPNSPQRI